MDAMDLLALLTRRYARTIRSLARALAIDEAAVVGLAQPLVDDGLVVVWLGGPKGACYCLTPLAVEQLGLEPPVAEVKPMRVGGKAVISDPGGLNQIEGTAPEPWEQLEAAEAAAVVRAAGKKARPDVTYPAFLPDPTLLIGEGMIWHGPKWAAGRPCPACKGTELAPEATCLLCDRWGLDHLAVPIRAGLGSRMKKKGASKGAGGAGKAA